MLNRRGATLEGFGSIFVLFLTLLLGSSSYSPDFFRDITGGLSHWLSVSPLYLTTKSLLLLLGFSRGSPGLT